MAREHNPCARHGSSSGRASPEYSGAIDAAVTGCDVPKLAKARWLLSVLVVIVLPPVGACKRADNIAVAMTAPWTSMDLPLDMATVSASTPDRLVVRFLAGAADQVPRIATRLKRIGYIAVSGIGVDGAVRDQYRGEGGNQLSVRYDGHAGAGDAVTVTFAMHGKHVAPPRVAVAWAGEASVHDVLGTAFEALAAVPVPRRPPTAAGENPTGSAFSQYAVTTACGENYCTDGLAATHGAATDTVVVGSALTADDREILGADTLNSWLERGIKVLHVDDKLVSFYRAEAWFSDGAAHSNAELSCHTYRRAGPASLTAADGKHIPAPVRTSIAAVFSERETQAVLDGVQWFFEDQGLEQTDTPGLVPAAFDSSNFFVDGTAGSVLFCIAEQVTASAGHVRLLRATLVPPMQGAPSTAP